MFTLKIGCNKSLLNNISEFSKRSYLMNFKENGIGCSSTIDGILPRKQIDIFLIIQDFINIKEVA